MRVYVYCMIRDQWFTQCLAEDLATSISAIQKFQSFETMIRALRYVGATEAAIAQLVDEDGLHAKGRGALWLDLQPSRKNLLLVYPKYLPSWCTDGRSKVSR